MSKFPVSFSRLSTFEQCPLKFEYLYVEKTVSDPGNTHTEYGNRVHESLEAYGKTGDVSTLTSESRPYKHLVDSVLRRDGEKFFEYQMAINADNQPCDWFATDVWLRGIADVLVINGSKAYCLDWKTGKVKENPTQLQLFACLIMLHFPQVESVNTCFIWLKYDKVTDMRFTRAMFDPMWRNINERFDRVQSAVDLGLFEPKPSRLCGWCPAKPICRYA